MDAFVSCLIVLAVLGAAAGMVLAARLTVRSRTEFRARVLETVAAALRGGYAVEPAFLWQVAHDVRGRRRRSVLRAASLLDDGLPIAAALATGLSLAPADASLLAVAEEGGALEAALRRVAGSARDGARDVHRVVLFLLVPTVTTVLLAATTSRHLQDFASCIDASTWELETAIQGARIVAATLAMAVLLTLLANSSLAGWVASAARRQCPGVGRRELAGWLAALSAAVRAGLPFDDALERTADAVVGRRARSRLRAAAERVRDGETVEAAWLSLPVSAWVRARAPLLAGSQNALADVLDGLAARADDMVDASRERMLRWLAPAAVLLAATAIGGVFLGVLLLTQRIALGVVLW